MAVDGYCCWSFDTRDGGDMGLPCVIEPELTIVGRDDRDPNDWWYCCWTYDCQLRSTFDDDDVDDWLVWWWALFECGCKANGSRTFGDVSCVWLDDEWCCSLLDIGSSFGDIL